MPLPPRILLERLYVDEGRPVREVAEVLGVSKSSVWSYLKEYKIEVRDKSEARKMAIRKGRV